MSLLFADIFEAIRCIRICKGTTEKDILSYIRERVGGSLNVKNHLKTVQCLNQLVKEGILEKEGKRYRFPIKSVEPKDECEEQNQNAYEEDDDNKPQNDNQRETKKRKNKKQVQDESENQMEEEGNEQHYCDASPEEENEEIIDDDYAASTKTMSCEDDDTFDDDDEFDDEDFEDDDDFDDEEACIHGKEADDEYLLTHKGTISDSTDVENDDNDDDGEDDDGDDDDDDDNNNHSNSGQKNEQPKIKQNEPDDSIKKKTKMNVDKNSPEKSTNNCKSSSSNHQTNSTCNNNCKKSSNNNQNNCNSENNSKKCENPNLRQNFEDEQNSDSKETDDSKKMVAAKLVKNGKKKSGECDVSGKKLSEVNRKKPSSANNSSSNGRNKDDRRVSYCTRNCEHYSKNPKKETKVRVETDTQGNSVPKEKKRKRGHTNFQFKEESTSKKIKLSNDHRCRSSMKNNKAMLCQDLKEERSERIKIDKSQIDQESTKAEVDEDKDENKEQNGVGDTDPAGQSRLSNNHQTGRQDTSTNEDMKQERRAVGSSRQSLVQPIETQKKRKGINLEKKEEKHRKEMFLKLEEAEESNFLCSVCEKKKKKSS